MPTDAEAIEYWNKWDLAMQALHGTTCTCYDCAGEEPIDSGYHDVYDARFPRAVVDINSPCPDDCSCPECLREAHNATIAPEPWLRDDAACDRDSGEFSPS